MIVGAKQASFALPAFDLRGSKGKAGETFALPLRPDFADNLKWC
jgi:hypothetical protein